MTSEQKRDKVLEYIKGTGWEYSLYYYWKSQTFIDSIDKLTQYTDEGKPFTPSFNNVFRFLKECPLHSIKAVIFIDDDCNYLDAHTGIPYSQNPEMLKKPEFPKTPDDRLCGRKNVAFFLKRLIKENESFDFDLTRWCKQGVLLLPYTPTSRIEGTPHYDLWRELRIRIIDTLNVRYPDIPWVLVGQRTIKMEDAIVSKNIQLFDLETLASQYIPWHENINKVLKATNRGSIKWL